MSKPDVRVKIERKLGKDYYWITLTGADAPKNDRGEDAVEDLAFTAWGARLKARRMLRNFRRGYYTSESFEVHP